MLLTMNSRKAATQRLEQLIEKGRSKAGEVVRYVIDNQPTDRLVRGDQFHFEADKKDGALIVSLPAGDLSPVRQRLHRHSILQMAAATDLPVKFIDLLQQTTEPWAPELLAHNLSTMFQNRFARRQYLLRSLGGEVRGFLSNRYRRLDSRSIVEAFAAAVQEKGAMPYEGYVTDTKVALQAIMPEVYEPIPGEMVAYGLSLENSDFGNGALSVRAYLLRIWCSNLAITQEEMRQVHLGRRLDEATMYSDRTYELDAMTTVSALRDVIAAQLNASALRERMDSIRAAHAKQVDAGSARDLLRKALLKSESHAVVEAYNSTDTHNLPAGNTVWRLSNAISWIAGKTEDAERKLELMKLAGEVLPSGKSLKRAA
jgi:hypothetical protein